MTDRISHLVVGLDQNIRDDDIDDIVTALRMVRHVMDVRPVVSDYAEKLAAERVRNELQVKLYDVIRDAFKEMH